MLIVWFLSIKSLPNLLFGVLCLPGDQSHPFAQPTINPLACCICWAGLLGRAVFPPWNEGPNFGSYSPVSTHVCKWCSFPMQLEALSLDQDRVLKKRLNRNRQGSRHLFPTYLSSVKSSCSHTPQDSGCVYILLKSHILPASSVHTLPSLLQRPIPSVILRLKPPHLLS